MWRIWGGNPLGTIVEFQLQSSKEYSYNEIQALFKTYSNTLKMLNEEQKRLRAIIINMLEMKLAQRATIDEVTGNVTFEMSNKDIGIMLGYADGSYIGRVLKNPDAKEKQPPNVSALTNIIVNLAEREDALEYGHAIQAREEQLHTLKEKFVESEKSNQTLQHKLRSQCMITVIAAATALIFFLLFVNRNLSKINGLVVSDKTTLENIMNHHGSYMVDALVIGLMEVRQEYPQIDFSQPFSSADSLSVRTSINEKIRDITRDARLLLTNINFVNKHGTNIVDYLEQIAPREKLMTEEDNLFRPKLENIWDFINSVEINDITKIKNKLKPASTDVQGQTWVMMWEQGWK